MNYAEWNTAIGRHFFNAGNGRKEVLLFVNEEKINNIGSVQNAQVDDFIGAMKKEAEHTKGNICKRALYLYQDWRDFGSEYPPYIAYLALFVLASTTEGDFDPKAYYPKYWKLVDHLGEGTPNSFHEMEQLWADLEKWSVEDKKEQFGRFKSRIRGHWCHVGRPLSQTLLSEDERKALPAIFYDCGFDPTNIPSEDIIKSGLIRHGSKRLRHRTLTLLKSQERDNEEFINSLLDLVITELEEWGKYEPVHPMVSAHTIDNRLIVKEREAPTPSLFFRTCIEFNHQKQHVTIGLRLKTTRSYPDNGLEFTVAGRTLTCSGTIPEGWSTKLVDASNNNIFDPSSIDWLKDWKFVDAENKWTVTYRGSSIRVFLPGDEEGMPGFIESQKLTRDSDFCIICDKSIAKSVETWGKESCTNFSGLTYSGIPSDWTLFKGVGATKPCKDIDVLGLSNLIRIQLEGGIGIGRSNQYLCFAPPKIRVDGGLGNEKLLLNGAELDKSASNVWALPKSCPTDRPLNIQISRDQVLLPESRVIELVEPLINTQSLGSTPKRNCRGNVIREEEVPDYVTGALVVSAKHDDIEPVRILPTTLGDSLIFVGQVAGQVSRWPSESLPSLWDPVWVLYRVSRKEWVARFCRQSAEANLAPIRTKEYSARKLREWREALWVMRKRTRSPELPALSKLWVRYMEAAKNI